MDSRGTSPCRGCGSLLDLTQEEIGQAVDEVLEATRREAEALRGACPLCGRSATVPVSHRRSIQLGVLLALFALIAVLVVAYYTHRDTERQQAVQDALQRLESHGDVTRYLGTPVTVHGEIIGEVKEDETGWQEVRLTMPVRGSRTDGVANLVGGRRTGSRAWTFTTLEVVMPKARKRVDLVAGRVVEYDQEAYIDAHTQPVAIAEYARTSVPPPRWDGEFPCVSALATPGSAPQIGRCATPVPLWGLRSGPADRFEVDLRFGKFILRETDLVLKAGDGQVPLTRTYTSQFWVHRSRVHAFGRNSTHDFDIAPVGSRNPYTYQMIVLPDGDFLYSPRISKGGGYADAVYQHSETASSFYQAITRWDGGGWDTRFADGSRIHFPESYNARNMAQGAPTEMADARGTTLHLVRDPQRNLLEVRTSDRRGIRFAYDSQARVVRAEDDQRWVEYRYNGDGMLTDVSHSDGRARHYTYDGHLLTGVQDERGRVLIRNSYRTGMLVEQQYSNGASCQFRYDMAANQSYAESATVMFSDGSPRAFRTGDSIPQYIKDIKR